MGSVKVFQPFQDVLYSFHALSYNTLSLPHLSPSATETESRLNRRRWTLDPLRMILRASLLTKVLTLARNRREMTNKEV